MTEDLQYAGAWRRWGALAIDGVLVAVILGGLVALLKPAGPNSVHLFLFGAPDASVFVMRVVTAVATLAWLAIWQARTGTTPGMMLFRLRVLNPSRDANPSPLAAIVRNAVPLLGYAIVILGELGPIYGHTGVREGLNILSLALQAAIGITISRSPTRQGIHDKLAGGTYVMRIESARSTTLDMG